MVSVLGAGRLLALMLGMLIVCGSARGPIQEAEICAAALQMPARAQGFLALPGHVTAHASAAHAQT